MTFKVEKLPAADEEISALEQAQQELLKSEYAKIEHQGIEFLRVNPLQSKIFEIKSNELRSLFKYQEGRIAFFSFNISLIYLVCPTGELNICYA